MRPIGSWARPRHLAIVALMGLAGCSGMAGGQVEHGNVAFAVSPDGKLVVFSAADGDLYLLTLETKRVERLTATEVEESSPSFSPDGKSIVHASRVEGRKGSCLFVRSLDGKVVRRLTDDPAASDSSPSFSPDGTRVAFARAYRNRPYGMGGWTWDQYDLCVVDLDGTNLRRVTSQAYYQAGRPSSLDGGKTLCFSASGARPGDPTTLFTVPVDGSTAPKPMTSPQPAGFKGGAWAIDPAASPDGKRVAFVSDRSRPFHYDVWTMDVDGTNPRSLGATEASRYNQRPTFLPDGKGLLFLAGAESNASNRPIFGLWKVGLDGGRPALVADSKLFTDPTHWPEAPEPARPAAPPAKP